MAGQFLSVNLESPYLTSRAEMSCDSIGPPYNIAMKLTTDEWTVRLDKWLWAARFFKTRSLAKTAIEGGKVHYNGTRAKPSRPVEVGAVLRLRKGFDDLTVEVLALSDRRGPAPEARKLYQETEDSQAHRERTAELRRQSRLTQVAPDHKPSKKERRDLQRLKKQSPEP